MKCFGFFLIIGLLLHNAGDLHSQPAEIYIPRNIQKAYENNTRSFDGKLGPRYWQNAADYEITVDFDPTTLLLKGEEQISYFNHSPDTLWQLIIHLFPDFYKKGNARDYDIDASDETNGVTLEKLAINNIGMDLSAAATEVKRGHSSLVVTLPSPLPPKNSLQLNITWQYTINRASHLRTGAVDSSACFIAYFYPRVAVYDDIDGWNNFQYRGETEFYNDFGNFELTITVPADFMIWSTGQLENPDEVLSKSIYERYKNAWQSDSIIHIIDSTEILRNRMTYRKAKQTWKFKAEMVSDVAFAVSDHYLWDASSMVVDQKTGRRVLIDAAYDKRSEDYYHTAAMARKAVAVMSQKMPAIPFPYPKITIFNGLDEMEYPMMVNLLSYADHHSSSRVTIHEIFHTYVPFYCGINETRYAWMDEGITTFATYLITAALDGPEYAGLSFYEEYLANAGGFNDLPLFLNSEYLKKPIYNIIYYTKTAAFLLVLQDLLGEDLFRDAVREFMLCWQGKHPTPYDLFYTLMEVTEQDLSWLITAWFFEYGYVDLAIRSVLVEGSQNQILIEKIGPCPVPVHLKITYDDGETETIHQSAAVWKDGKRNLAVKGSSSKKLKSVELLNITLIEADMSNNILTF